MTMAETVKEEETLDWLGRDELIEKLAEEERIESLSMSTFWGAELRVALNNPQTLIDFMRLHMEDGEDGLVQGMALPEAAAWFRAHGGEVSFGVSEAVRWPFRIASYISLWHLRWQCRQAV